MSLLDTFIGRMAPHDCLGCGAEGELLCGNCRPRLAAVPPRCYRCYKVSAAALTCTGCRQTSQLHRVRPVTLYEDLAKDLIWKLKSGGAQAAAKQLAAHMAALLSGQVGETPLRFYVVPVPTATSRARQRGYDQAKLLARELSRQSRLPYLDCLVRTGQTHQVGASRRERLAQLAGAFRVERPGRFQGCVVLLVDDVVTTGATLEAAAAVLKRHGARRVEAVVFAQA